LAARVARQCLVEQLALAFGDLVATLLCFGAQDVQQFRGADADAVHDRGEDLHVLVGFQIQIGAPAERVPAGVHRLGQPVQRVAEIVRRVRQRRPRRGDQPCRVECGTHPVGRRHRRLEPRQVVDAAVGREHAGGQPAEPVRHGVAPGRCGTVRGGVGRGPGGQPAEPFRQFGDLATGGAQPLAELGQRGPQVVDLGEDFAVVHADRAVDRLEHRRERVVPALGLGRLLCALLGVLGGTLCLHGQRFGGPPGRDELVVAVQPVLGLVAEGGDRCGQRRQ